MTFNEYHQFTDTTAVYPMANTDIIYPVLGLNGEAGEVAEKIKKIIRDSGGFGALWSLHRDKEKVAEIAAELGDVLWYLARCCTALEITLNEVAVMNKRKLTKRLMENKLHGSGDNR